MTSQRGVGRLRRLVPVAVLACLAATAPFWPRALAAEARVRPAARAGAFYPSSPRELRGAVERYLREATPVVPAELAALRPRALIVPHAGYAFSGATAAFSYKLLEGKPKPSRIVLIGPSHLFALQGTCSVADFSHYETPLGKVPVDGEAREQLVKSAPFRAMRHPHEQEHCLEVQLPFLQVLWPEPPPIVPILAGRLSAEQCRAAAAGIAGILDEDSLLIVSTDFTHYGRGFRPFAGTPTAQLRDRIEELDMEGVGLIQALDPEAFYSYLKRKNPTVCGGLPVDVMLNLFSQSAASRTAFLHWANSSQTSGDFSYCVSYVALAVYAPSKALQEIKKALAGRVQAAAPEDAAPSASALELTDEQKRILLTLARQAAEKALAATGDSAGGGLRVILDDMPEALRANCGAFVTLTKDGRLRGCIGHISSEEPLCKCVARVAALAATRDPRFPPVTREELADCTIEISVLSPLVRAAGLEDIEVGRDGLVISSGYRRGLLLPQVAAEQGWTAQQFLEQTCLKAGLPRGAWRRQGVTIQRFTATVFGEEELGLR